MSVNDNVCWKKTGIVGNSGKQLCGTTGKQSREKVFRVKNCYVELSAAIKATVPLTVHLWTNLDGEAGEESFGIDNVVITKLEEEGNTREIYDRLLPHGAHFIHVHNRPARNQEYYSLTRKCMLADEYTSANSHVNTRTHAPYICNIRIELDAGELVSNRFLQIFLLTLQLPL